jgi:hypothetical protein
MLRRAPSFRLLVPALLAVAALFASAAAAEMPSNRDAPTITEAGGPVVGETLLGNNGTWLYADGSPCRGECAYAFVWQRCHPGGDCAEIPGGADRAYRVGDADVGRSLRVIVTATKFDCNAHGQDCRNVSRTAVSAPTPPVATPSAPPVRLAITRVGVERARRGLVVAVGVKDDRGRPVRAARVTVRGSSALTGVTGAARVAVRTSSRATSVPLAVRAEKGRAEPAAIEVRLPLAG